LALPQLVTELFGSCPLMFARILKNIVKGVTICVAPFGHRNQIYGGETAPHFNTILFISHFSQVQSTFKRTQICQRSSQAVLLAEPIIDDVNFFQNSYRV
jgi:hypothetical protein